MRRRDLLIRLGLAASAVGGLWWLRDNVIWRAPEPVFPAAGRTDWLPFVARANVPVVEATVAGRPVRALIDSGAQYSVVDRALVESLGLRATVEMPLVAYGVSGQPQLGRGLSLDVALGGVALNGLRTAMLDLGPLAAGEGPGTALILGQDVLGTLIVEIEPERRRLRLTRPEAYRPGEDLRPVEVKRSGRALATSVTVEGAAIEAVVDTGSSALLALSQATAAEAGLLDGRPARAGSSIVLGGAMASRIVTARTLTFGDLLYRRVEIPIYPDVAIPGFPDALLGMEAFAERRMALDLGAGRLWASRPMDVTVS